MDQEPNKEGAIGKLEEELRQLQKELAAQYGRLQELQQRVQQLKGGADVNPTVHPVAKKSTPSFTWENFIGLRLIHLVGIVVLVIGLSIGVKYALDKELISDTARIALAYAAGGLLLFLAWKLRKNYVAFSAILFSGGMASLYFTTYAAFVYYGLLPFGLAFSLMALLTVVTATQAVRYNRAEIAVLGLVGAYGIPFLISRNAERAELFFLYIFLINLGVLYLCFRKGWKNVGRLAQVLTWLLFLGWSSLRFTAPQTGTALLFMGLFFLLFTLLVGVTTVYRKNAFSLNDVHQQLLNNAALFTAVVFVLAPDFSDRQLAAVCGLYSLFGAAQTFVVHRLLPKEAYLHRVHLVFSLVLAVLFVAYQWDGFLVTLIWLLVSVVLFAGGVWSKSVTLRMAAIGLMGLTLLKLLVLDSQRFSPVQKVIAYLTLGLLLLVVSFFYQKFRQKLFDKNE